MAVTLQKFVAFDYTSQEWITGDPARRLLIAQGYVDLSLSRESGYLTMIGATFTEFRAALRVRMEAIGAGCMFSGEHTVYDSPLCEGCLFDTCSDF